ncbi:MAG: glycosyltransferase [Gammaproteobacteria bacterium]|nr:glycosyltransferase [Gammaproteobacteria bacterium]
MTKKHILHVTYDMNIGGTEQVIRNLIEGLDPDQFISSVLCIDGEVGPWGKELQKKGVEHFCLTRKPGFDLNLIKAIRKLIKHHKFDIIHCHQYTPYTYGWFGSIFTNTPIIFTEHGRFHPDSSSPKRKLINPLLQLRTAAITAISKATKQALVEFENFNEQKIDVIYNGIEDTVVTPSASLRTELGINSDDIVFGTISRLDPIKNQTMMLRAFKQAKDANNKLRLLIVGDGPSKKELHDLTKELELTDSVIFTGFQPNPQAYLALMDVFLLPSFSEGTSMTLLEAMSFSIPSIATSVGGTPEILKHQSTGILSESDDTNELTQAMTALTEDPTLRVEYGKNARNRYETKFPLAVMTKNYQILYNRVLSE